MHDYICLVCGIGIRFLPLAEGGGAWVHVEPRTIENNLHNNTSDHNAVGPQVL